MYVSRKDQSILALEAAANPYWCTRWSTIPITYLKTHNFQPWRYKHMAPPKAKSSH